MIGNVMTYSGIVTKIHAMRAKLLKSDDYRRLASMQTVTDIIHYLKDTAAYGPLIAQMDESLYHRGNIEKILAQSLYGDYTRLYHFADMKQKEFLKLFKKRYEADLIRYCLRIVFNHYKVPFDLDYKKEFFDKYSDIKIDQLATSENIASLIDNLRETEYYEPLIRIRDSGAETLFDYELTLDLYYFSKMWGNRKKAGTKSDVEIFTKDMGTNIDFLNLQWIYRAKKYYHMMPPDIYTLLMPIHYRLLNKQIKALVEAPSIEEFFRVLNDTFYGRKYQFDEKHNVESIVNQCLKQIFTKVFRNHSYSMSSLCGYLFLKEEEIDKITTVLECIRYGLSERETLQYISDSQSQDSRQQGGNRE